MYNCGMKMLFISPNSPRSSVGGVERCIKNLISFGSDALDTDKTLFVLPSDTGDGYEKIGNSEIYYRGFLQMATKDSSGKIKLNLSDKIIKGKAKKFYDFIVKLLNSEKIDIVTAENFHLGMPPAFSLMLNMACQVSNVPLILRVHSFAIKPIQGELINNLLWEKIVCVSKSVAGDCFSKGAEISKLTTNHLGVNIQEFFPTGDRTWLKKQLGLGPQQQVILGASRIVMGTKEIIKEKGLVILIEAFSKIAFRFNSLRLVLAVGKPPQFLSNEFAQALEKLKGFIKLNGVEDRVICEPFALEQMPQVYRGADMFVLPSENETLGQVYIEAMASGIPVIGTNVGGIPEIIHHGENGFLSALNDASMLAGQITQLLEDEKLRKSFIEKGLKTVRTRFGMHKLTRELFDYYAQIVAKSRGAVSFGNIE